MKLLRKPLLLIAVALLLVSADAHAQFAENIRSGRPGQAIGPFCLGSKVFQHQIGFTYNRVGRFPDENHLAVHQSVFRLGILERLEASAVLSTIYDKERNDKAVGGVSDFQIGLRYHLLEPKGARPAIGLQGRFLIPLQSTRYRRERTGLKTILVIANPITDRLAYNTNWTMLYEGIGGDIRFGYIWNLSYNLSDKWGVFAELYGQLNPWSANVDGGFSYLVNPDLQLDVSAGWQGIDSPPDWFVDLGVSWRLHWREQAERP